MKLSRIAALPFWAAAAQALTVHVRRDSSVASLSQSSSVDSLSQSSSVDSLSQSSSSFTPLSPSISIATLSPSSSVASLSPSSSVASLSPSSSVASLSPTPVPTSQTNASVTTVTTTPSATSSLPGPSSCPHPVVVWHGLGDSAQSDNMGRFADAIRDAYPGIFVHLVSLSDTAPADQRASFFGVVNDQVEQVCKQLAAVPELAEGFDAIGFSQGGQFLRAYVERCNAPPVRNLVTFGSQHMGVAGLPPCAPNDLLCRAASGLLIGGVNTDYAQSHVVTAQYYRNPREENEYEGYLAHNHFLTDINNEAALNPLYRQRLASLHNFVMVVFDDDNTVVPKESGWFASYPVSQGGKRGNDPDETVPLRETPLYKDDLLGLKALDQRGALIWDSCKGGHMNIDAACQAKILGRWIGAPKSKLAERLWFPYGRMFRYVGIHGGSWLGPLRWPVYTWTVNPDGSRRLQISPARFAPLGDENRDDGQPVIIIDVNTLDLVALVTLGILCVILLFKVGVAVLYFALFIALGVIGVLALPLLILVVLLRVGVSLVKFVLFPRHQRTSILPGPALMPHAEFSVTPYGSIAPSRPWGPAVTAIEHPLQASRPGIGREGAAEHSPPNYFEVMSSSAFGPSRKGAC